MKLAVERLYGHDREVEASDSLGHHNRYYCPECGEPIFLRHSSSIRGAYFAHKKKTFDTPECEKRVDGLDSISLTERLGLPLYLSEETNGFKLYIAFPPIGEQALNAASSNRSKLTINKTHSVIIDSTVFYDEQTTFLPVDFISMSGRYEIEYFNVDTIWQIKEKWSSYCEGFIKNGAVFVITSHGSKKVKKGDSLVVGQEYYYFCKSDYYQYYLNRKEIKTCKKGSLLLNGKVFDVYKMIIEIDDQANKSHIINDISDDLYMLFGVRLNDSSSELIPIWPPMIDTDSFIPIFNSRVTACIKSPDEKPNIFIYKIRSGQFLPQKFTFEDKIISLPVFYKELTFSVDRKFIGRERTIVKRCITPVGYEYKIGFKNSDSICFIDKNNQELFFDNLEQIHINSKLDLFVQSKIRNYRRISLRDSTYSLDSFSIGDELFFYSDDYLVQQVKLLRVRKQKKESYCFEIKSHLFGTGVNVPGWIYRLIRKLKCKGDYGLAKDIEKTIINDKIPIGLLKYLTSIKEELLYE